MRRVASTDCKVLRQCSLLQNWENVRYQSPSNWMDEWLSHTKAASVRSHHRNLEELELQYPLDAMVKVRPLAPVVSKLYGSATY
jgi:hypothetical protein